MAAVAVEKRSHCSDDQSLPPPPHVAQHQSSSSSGFLNRVMIERRNVIRVLLDDSYRMLPDEYHLLPLHHFEQPVVGKPVAGVE